MNIELLNFKNRNNFVEDSKKFIYNTAYKICKRHLNWENDDELSIALIAFNTACDNYNKDKGDFYSYSKVIIRNALIDYFRKNHNYPYVVFDVDEDTDMDYIDYKTSIEHYSILSENCKRAEEIALFSQELAKYKLDFNTLVNSSPSHNDTRNTLLNLAFACTKNEIILKHIKNKKLLPIKEICSFTGINKKLLEKWRRYILSLIIILSSEEYPYIKSYLNIKVGDRNDQNRNSYST